MSAEFKIKGMDKLMRVLSKEVQAIEGRTLNGMRRAVALVQREAEPGTPIDTGNLRASWFSVSYKGGTDDETETVFPEGTPELYAGHVVAVAEARGTANRVGAPRKPVVVFGYSANYATKVHESVDTKFKRPGAKARWLYSAIESNRERILEQIRKTAEIK